MRSKLLGIDKDGNSDVLMALLREVHEAQVARVQRAHRRHKAELPAGHLAARLQGSPLGDRAYDTRRGAAAQANARSDRRGGGGRRCAESAVVVGDCRGSGRCSSVCRVMGTRCLRHILYWKAKLAAEAAELGVGNGEGVDRLWKGALVDGTRISGERGPHAALELLELAHELGHLLIVQPKQIMEHLHLARGAAASADANRGHPKLSGDKSGHGGGNHLEDDGETARRLQEQRVLEESRCLLGIPALHTVASERRVRLRRETNVPHDGHARVDECAHLWHHLAAALEFDRVGPALLD